ncbi:MAG TPA: hypothetical protein VMN60_13145, partial [Longimicrobiales bacterium]|nr:hypothetical protein [Longimicrobiales bacterium]
VDSLMVVQQARVRLLTEQVEPRFQNIMRQTQQEIQALLTPEQRQQLRRLQQERSRLLQDPRLRPPPQQRVDQLREDIMRQLREENAQRARDMRARQNDRMRGGLPPVRPDTLDRRLPR